LLVSEVNLKSILQQQNISGKGSLSVSQRADEKRKDFSQVSLFFS
jgi:hypothetical protein